MLSLIAAETPRMSPIEFPIAPWSVALAVGVAGLGVVAVASLVPLVRAAVRRRNRRL